MADAHVVAGVHRCRQRADLRAGRSQAARESGAAAEAGGVRHVVQGHSAGRIRAGHGVAGAEPGDGGEGQRAGAVAAGRLAQISGAVQGGVRGRGRQHHVVVCVVDEVVARNHAAAGAEACAAAIVGGLGVDERATVLRIWRDGVGDCSGLRARRDSVLLAEARSGQGQRNVPAPGSATAHATARRATTRAAAAMIAALRGARAAALAADWASGTASATAAQTAPQRSCAAEAQSAQRGCPLPARLRPSARMRRKPGSAPPRAKATMRACADTLRNGARRSATARRARERTGRSTRVVCALHQTVNRSW